MMSRDSGADGHLSPGPSPVSSCDRLILAGRTVSGRGDIWKTGNPERLPGAL